MPLPCALALALALALTDVGLAAVPKLEPRM